MKKSVLRALINDEIAKNPSLVTVYPASKKKVKTFRNSSSVSNRGHKLIMLRERGFARGRS